MKRYNIRKRSAGIRGATIACMAVLCLLLANLASAHGSLEDPPSRTYTCRFLDLDDPMCSQAWATNPQSLYDWMEVNLGDVAGNHQAYVPDGELCSAGREKYAAFDIPGDWPTTALNPDSNGLYTVTFYATAPHAPEYFRFYLTREGFDPLTDTLTWSDLELVHDTGSFPYAEIAAQPHYPIQMELPGREGRYILYTVWQRSDSPEAFYSCSDVVIGENSVTTVDDPYPTPETETGEETVPAVDTSDGPVTSAPGLNDVNVSVQITDDWGAGACGEGTVFNDSNGTVAWEAHVELDGNVTTYWDSVMNLSTHPHDHGGGSGAHWRVVGASWNTLLEPGASTTFGFCMDRTSVPAPAEHASMDHEMGHDMESDSGESEPVAETPGPPAPEAGPEDSEAPPAAQETITDTSDPVTTTPELAPAANPASGPAILAAYYPEWGIYGRNYQIADVPAGELTHLIYAFADLDSNGNVTLFDPYAAVEKKFPANESVSGIADSQDTSGRSIWGNFGQIALLKEKYPHLRVSIAVGGWTLSTHFSSVLATAEGREYASDSLVDFLTRYDMFDGVDFDWEYPGGGGLAGNSTSSQDGVNYALFLNRVREKLDLLSATTGHDYEISVASPAGYDKIQNFNLGQLHGVLDFFNVMTYDLHGTWENVTGHQAALENDPVGYDVSTAVQLYLDAGVPREKIVLGFPLYTRAWKGVAAGDDGGYAEPSGGAAPGSFLGQNGMYDYKDLLDRLLAEGSSWELYWDDYAQAAYLYDSSQGIFSSFETPGTAAFKSEWAQALGLGGMMFWDLSNDKTGDAESLITAASNSWHKGLSFDEIVANSSVEFDYILGGNGRFDTVAEADTLAVDIVQDAPGDETGEPVDSGNTPSESGSNAETESEEDNTSSNTEEAQETTDPQESAEVEPTNPASSNTEGSVSVAPLLIEVAGDRWWQGFTAELTIRNTSATELSDWSFVFRSSHAISGTPWGIDITSTDLGNGLFEYRVQGAGWTTQIPAGGSVTAGFSAQQGQSIGNEGPLSAELVFDGGIVTN